MWGVAFPPQYSNAFFFFLQKIHIPSFSCQPHEIGKYFTFLHMRNLKFRAGIRGRTKLSNLGLFDLVPIHLILTDAAFPGP